MRLNQFARLNPDHATQIAELNTIGLPTEKASLAELAHATYQAFEARR